MPTDRPRMTMRPGVQLLVNLLGDKWTVPVIHLLSPGPRRHAELKRGLPGISQRMLTRPCVGSKPAGCSRAPCIARLCSAWNIR